MIKNTTANDPVSKSKDASLPQRVKKFMWDQARLEMVPLTMGGIALMVSSYSNQVVPTLVGKLLDPTSHSARHYSSLPRSNSTTNTTTTFAASILWVGLVGGTASFVRTLLLHQAHESIAARLRKLAFESLLTGHDLESFHTTSPPTNDDEENHNDDTESNNPDPSENKKDDKKAEDSSKDAPGLVTAPPSMTPGAIGVILRDDVEAVASTMTTTLANLFRSSSSCIFSSYNMLLLNPHLFGLSLAVAPIVGTLALLTRKYIKKIDAIRHDSALNAASFVEERLNHIAMVKMSNRESDEIETFGQIQDQLVALGGKSAFANGLSMGTMFFFSTSALCGILMTGGKAVEAKRMEHGQLVSFGTYSFLLALGSAGVIKAMGEYSRGLQSATRLFQLIVPTPVDKSSPKPNSELQSGSSVDVTHVRDLKLEKLQFAYHGEPRKEVIRDVSLTLSRGEIVALVGRNGAGKSTIAMLLAGLYEPTSGKIVIALDHPSNKNVEFDYVNGLSRNDQAKLVQVVPQHPAIFSASILDNIKYTYPQANDEEVLNALKAANADHFISQLEGGMKYQVGRNGSRLSGGQRQRVGLARALLANPTFLVLDEPASSLDSEGENAVVDAIKACRHADRSLLVITHSPKTVRLADRVVVLKDGQVVEQGTFSQLEMKKGELFTLMPDLNES
mmetsp:Transcript_83119/g.240135  ORF Transcript_83119/g.240135 Transcript_83119/m.240135 type:complete len:676 (-) Transcript_83119:36-2063(-)